MDSRVPRREEIYGKPVALVISQAFLDANGLGMDDPIMVTILSTAGSHLDSVYLGRVRASMGQLPGDDFHMRSDPNAAEGSMAVITTDEYHRMAQHAHSNYALEKSANSPYFEHPSPREQWLRVRLRAGSSDAWRTDFKERLAHQLGDGQDIFDFLQLAAVSSQVGSLIAMFLSFVFFFAFCMASYLIALTFASNIVENIWESGVLLSLGVSHRFHALTFLVEALALLLSSLLLGALIGAAVSAASSLLNSEIIRISFWASFRFPYLLVTLSFLLGLSLSFLSSMLPAFHFLHPRRPIASLFRSH